MISLKQLTYALAVERTLHFKKAAELCHVSQSALSTALSELENQLGLKIFERDNKKVLVTPLGKEVLEHARKVSLEVEELQHLADRQKSPMSYPINVGIIPTIAPYFLPRVFPVLQEQFPEAEINVVEEQSGVLVDLVRRGEIDTALLALPYSLDGLLSIEFWKEDFYWITADPQYARRKNIPSLEIDQSQLILLKDGHCLKDHILDVCKTDSGLSNANLAATSLNTLIQLVQANLGTTLIPQMAVDQLVASNPQLAAIHLDEPSPHRRIAFVIRPNYTRMNAIETLAKVSRKALKN